MTRMATCSVCGEAFLPEQWQRDRGRMLCPSHVGDTKGDPRDTPEARRVRADVLRGDPPCHWCGAKATTIDHYPIPVMHGGETVPWNVVPACESCNKSRGPRPGPPRGIIERIKTDGVHADPTPLTEEQLLRTWDRLRTNRLA